MLKLKPGGPRLTKEGQERYDTTSTSNRGKNGKGKGSGDTTSYPSHPATYDSRRKSVEFTGSADHEPGVGVAPAALHPPGTEGAPCTNQNFPTTAKEREKKKDAEDKSKRYIESGQEEAEDNRKTPRRLRREFEGSL